MYDVITVGSATVDLFAHTEFSEQVHKKTRKGEAKLIAYPVGAKILINRFEVTTGGGGTNVAVALRRLGYKVAWFGKMGKDENGDIILRELMREKVRCLGVRGEGNSGYSVILDSKEHDRTILAYKGLNDELKSDEVPWRTLRHTRWFYFSSMVGESYKSLEKIAEFAAGRRISIAFNPSLYQAKEGAKRLRRVLSSTTILILNREEAKCLVRGAEPASLAKSLTALGPEIAVVTDGKKGAWCYQLGNAYHITPPKVKVVETTGAGDAFGAGFLAGFIKRADITLALKMGQANASSVIQYHGAKNKLLTEKEALLAMERLEVRRVR